MTITLTLTAESGEDLRNQLRAIISENSTQPIVMPAGVVNTAPGAVNYVGGSEPKPPAKRGRKAIEKAEANQADLAANPPEFKQVGAAAAEVIAKTAAPVAPATPDKITPVEIEKLMRSLAATKGTQTARDLLTSFNMRRMSELSAEKYAEFYAAMQKIMGV